MAEEVTDKIDWQNMEFDVMITKCRWPESIICVNGQHYEINDLAAVAYDRVCRIDFTMPGFCVIDVGFASDSVAFRQLMVDMKRELASIHERARGNTLIYMSAARFDQQSSTKFHLDGGPEESLLMLGYEPSGIAAELEIADYSRCADDLGISPQQFMATHNPMFRSGAEMLRPYTTLLQCFDPTRFQIVVINNSSAPIDGKSWLGTLHTATIPEPNQSMRRVINSTMIAPALPGTPDVVSDADLDDFINTSRVLRRGYATAHLDDDV